MDACKMVRLKALHLSPLPSKLVHLGQSLLAACFPFVFPEASWPVTANGKKVLTAEDKEICTVWVQWGGPDPVTFGVN